MKWYDVLVYLFVAAGAVVLAAVGFCAADWGYALATVIVVALWAWCLYRKTRPEDSR